MNLGELGGATAQGSVEMPRLTAAVNPASHQQAEPASEAVATDSPGTWKSTIRFGKTEEPTAKPSPAPNDSSASGWKSVQRAR
jgi:hypothetical protein